MAEVIDRVQNNSQTTVELTEITHILVTQDKYYALRFDDEESAQKLLEIFNDDDDKDKFQKELKDNYEDDNTGSPLYQSTTSTDKQLAHIYNLFSKYGLNMSMYKANKDNDGNVYGWNKINKETRNEEPCN